MIVVYFCSPWRNADNFQLFRRVHSWLVRWCTFRKLGVTVKFEVLLVGGRILLSFGRCFHTRQAYHIGDCVLLYCMSILPLHSWFALFSPGHTRVRHHAKFCGVISCKMRFARCLTRVPCWIVQSVPSLHLRLDGVLYIELARARVGHPGRIMPGSGRAWLPGESWGSGYVTVFTRCVKCHDELAEYVKEIFVVSTTC